MWDASQFKAFDGVPPAAIIAIRNELANDGILYTKNVKPIFQESLGEAVSFFDSWNE